jgi:carbamoyl-phosphate synthase small subunit
MRLVLEDGTEMSGKGFAAMKPVGGEVVFNTAMTGYVETLTDPSYRGQILVTTYPLVGNYGVPKPRPEGSIEPPFEADRIQVQGLVVQTYVDAHSHHAGTRSLGEWLRSDGVPAVTGIDTRTLTRRLREHGTMRGWLFPANMTLERAKARRRDRRDEGGALPPRRPETGHPLQGRRRSRSCSSTPARRTTSSARCSSAACR